MRLKMNQTELLELFQNQFEYIFPKGHLISFASINIDEDGELEIELELELVSTQTKVEKPTPVSVTEKPTEKPTVVEETDVPGEEEEEEISDSPAPNEQTDRVWVGVQVGKLERADLEAFANFLEISFRSNLGDEKLADRVHFYASNLKGDDLKAAKTYLELLFEENAETSADDDAAIEAEVEAEAEVEESEEDEPEEMTETAEVAEEAVETVETKGQKRSSIFGDVDGQMTDSHNMSKEDAETVKSTIGGGPVADEPAPTVKKASIFNFDD